MSAITLAYGILAENYRGKRIRIQNCIVTEPQLNEVSDLFSISGPKFNSITERYMRTLGSPLQFSEESRSLILGGLDGSCENFVNKYRPSGDPEVCYGIVVGAVVTCPGGRKQNILICAGSNSFATYGCVVFLDDLRYRRSLRGIRPLATLRKQNKWGIIVRIQNLSSATAPFQGQLPFERAQLDVQVVRSLMAADFSG